MSNTEVPTPGNPPAEPVDLDNEVATEGVQPTTKPDLNDEVATEGAQPSIEPTDDEIPGNPGNPVEE